MANTANKTVTVPNDPWEKVSLRLPRDRNEGRGLYVCVNDHSFFIPRGQEVLVPRFIYEVVDNSLRQDEATAAMIDGLAPRE